MHVAKICLSTPNHKIRHKNLSIKAVSELEDNFEYDRSLR